MQDHFEYCGNILSVTEQIIDCFSKTIFFFFSMIEPIQGPDAVLNVF